MEYNLDEQPLHDRKQTSDEIKRLVRTFCADLDNINISVRGRLIPLSSLSFDSYFNYVKDLPYRRDKAPIEQIGRPSWIMEKKRGIADCKKKAILICSWLQLQRIPWRLVGSSNRKDRQIHHIFPQAKSGGAWINVDATYSDYRIGEPKTVTAREYL